MSEIKTMSLDEIQKEMIQLQTSDDTEMAHSQADDLLGELIKSLVIGTPNEEQARKIWNAYCAIDKWFA